MRELLSRLSCPLCGGTHGDTLLAVIDSPAGGPGSVRAQCVRCHLFWSFSLEGAWESPVAAGHRRRTLPNGPISDDELIELHCFLKDFSGSFEELLARTG
jgi:hypothetical protein